MRTTPGGGFASLPALLLLRLAPRLFPATDYRHCVLTPALVLLARTLAFGAPSGPRAMASALFTAQLLLEVCPASGGVEGAMRRTPRAASGHAAQA